MQNKENKNIDQLFKDRLKGMEPSPPPVVWENIQKQLGHKKGTRKVIPLWWKLGGVAAAFVLLFSVANMLMNDNQNSFININNQLVIDETVKSTQKSQVQPVFEENITDKKGASNTHIIKEVNVASQNINNEVEATMNISTPTSNKTTTPNNQFNNTTIVSTTISNTKLKNQNTQVFNNKEGVTQNAVATFNEKTNTINNKRASFLKKDEGVKTNETITAPLKESVANDSQKKAEQPKEAIGNDALIKGNTKSIFDAIDEQKEAVAKTKDELPANRWAISPNVAPVYYNSLSQGSSIDPTFADNTQNGEVNVSYGINVSYAVSPRLTVRSGVSNVNLSYATGGLELATGDASAALQAITYTNTGTIVTALDQGVLNNTQAEGSPYANLTRKATEGDVLLTQSITYTEIPTELTYKLVNKRFGLNVIGGFSTLLLGNNEVSVSASNFNEVLGEANNLSDVSFSTNVGLGASYQLTKKFTFNVEPVFKYQLNPYTDNTVQFKPYYVGVYSGLSFKF